MKILFLMKSLIGLANTRDDQPFVNIILCE